MRTHNRMTLILIALACCLGATAAPAQEVPECDGPVLNAVATIGMIADVVSNVGGECVAVTQMMGAGVDPHLYRASESDVVRLLEADVVFYNGLNLEARLADIFEQMSTATAVAVGQAIPPDRLLQEPNFNQTDPHVWMDVSLWMYTVESVRDTLIALDPAHEPVYRRNADAYLEELEALDLYVQEQIYRIPRGQRVLVTAHDAFHYFGRAYGIDVFAPQGITTATEAGVEDIRRTINVIVQRQVPAVFVESSVPPDVIEAIVEGAGAQGQAVAIGGQLFSDAMGEIGTPEGTYAGMIRHNVDTIVAALLGEATGE